MTEEELKQQILGELSFVDWKEEDNQEYLLKTNTALNNIIRKLDGDLLIMLNKGTVVEYITIYQSDIRRSKHVIKALNSKEYDNPIAEAMYQFKDYIQLGTNESGLSIPEMQLIIVLAEAIKAKIEEQKEN